MNVLAEILSTVQLGGSVFFEAELTDPWSIHVPPCGRACRFHIVNRGRCWIKADDCDDWIPVSENEVGLVPRGAGHCISFRSDCGSSIELDKMLRQADFTPGFTLRWGGFGPLTRITCGQCEFRGELLHPFFDALPSVLAIPLPTGAERVDALIEMISAEMSSENPASEAVVNRLSEILFIRTIEAFWRLQDQEVIAGVADAGIASVLQALHERLDEPWTLASMAVEANVSRSSFALRFKAVMGMSPMQYLFGWRMEKAFKLLRNPQLSVAQVGSMVGYRSEAAFNRAFTRRFGHGPGAFRRRFSRL